MNLGSWCNSIEGTAVEVIKVCTTPTQFWKSKTRNKLVLVPVMPESCIEILTKENAQIQWCRELAAKWKKQTFSAKKNPSNWRLTWIQQMKKLAAISCKGNDKICTVWTTKKLSRSTRHDRIHSCCFKSRMLTHTACLHQKRRKGCLVLIPFATETAVELNRAYTTSTSTFEIESFIWQNIEDGTCVLIQYSQYVMFFPPQDCCESEKICNVVDNDQKLKGSNWWLTCIQWDFRSRRNA